VKKKNQKPRSAAHKFLLLLLLLAALVVGILLWASQAVDSQVAQNIRQFVGLPEPAAVVEVPSPEPAPVVVEVVPEPEPEPIIEPEPEPEPLLKITFPEVAARRYLWPSELSLKLSVQVPIRYNGKIYGNMEFVKGSEFIVDALMPTGEILGRIGGNYLSLSVHETNFYGWFNEEYGDRFEIQPVVVDSKTGENSGLRLGTAEGDAAFWSEMRIWCYQNYESVTLKVEEDTLVFIWMPKEDVPINFTIEAREIARQYLLKQAAFGGTDNYAACEIRDPVTNQLRGVSSIFIPRL
jgi:hypothetical protein